MSVRWTIAFIFLGALVLSGLLVIPMHSRYGLEADAGKFFKSLATIYGVPLGTIVASLFKQRPALPDFEGAAKVFAIAVAVVWNLVPVGIAAYGAFWPEPAGLDEIVKDFDVAVIPVNAAFAAILTALYPA